MAEMTVNQRGDKHKARRAGRVGWGPGTGSFTFNSSLHGGDEQVSFNWQAVPCTVQNTLSIPLLNAEHFIHPTAEYRTLYPSHCWIQNTLSIPLRNTEHFSHPTAEYRTLQSSHCGIQNTSVIPLWNTEHFSHPTAEYRTLYKRYSWCVRNERQWEWLGSDVRQVSDGRQPICRKGVGGGVWGTLEVLHAFSGDFVGEGFRTYRNQNQHLWKTPASSGHVPTLPTISTVPH